MELADRSWTADSSVAPVNSGVVSRRALLGRIGAAGRVIVVSAPAGSGKTFLLRSWIGESGLEEARALFEATGVTLSGSALARLHDRTEGWAAGLRPAALSLAGHPETL